MSRNEKKGHGGKHTRPKKWSGARRPAGPATTALFSLLYHFLKSLFDTIKNIPKRKYFIFNMISDTGFEI